VERPIGFVRERFWPGRRFTSLLKPLPATPFDCDDKHSTQVTKMFRVRFDRNSYSVPPRLVGQTVLIRANDEQVAVYLGPRQVALHPRCWGVSDDIEHPSHRLRALEDKPTRSPLPPGLTRLGEVGEGYFRVLLASRRSIQREIVRLTFLSEVFGERETRSAIEEVLKTGHVGCEYVEYVLRHKRNLVEQTAPLKLGKPELDGLAFAEPDLAAYDNWARPEKTLDPGLAPTPLDSERPSDHEDL
jgi:hypothetical protein